MIKLRYKDKNGTVNTNLEIDGHRLNVQLRGIELEGLDFESFESKEKNSIFNYSDFGDLTNFSMEFVLPMSVLALPSNTRVEQLSCKIVAKNKAETKIDLKLITSKDSWEVKNKRDFEYALIDLQKLLPKGDFLKSCLSCRYSHYHPVGNGIFGSLHCFSLLQEEALKISDKFELMNLWTDEAVENELIFNVQETHLCDRFELVKRDDWVYKDWNFTE